MNGIKYIIAEASIISLSKNNKQLAQIGFKTFERNGRNTLNRTANIVSQYLNEIDIVFERTPFLNSPILLLIYKIIIVGLFSILVHTAYACILVVKKIFQLLEPSKDEIKITDLPEDCSNEIRALEKRWQKQNLPDEEIQANLKFWIRDMQIGQRGMKKEEIKLNTKSLIARIILQLRQYFIA